MKAVFLDRDDTLIRNIPYLGDPAQVEVLPGVPEALRRLKDAGFSLIVVSNQSGVGRGMITEDQVAAVNAEMENQIGADLIDAYYLCYEDPNDPEAPGLRKPSPAMLLLAQEERGIDLAASFMVGDKAIDVQCGRNAGCKSVLVLTGPEQDRKGSYGSVDFTAEDMEAASQWILKNVAEAKGEDW